MTNPIIFASIFRMLTIRLQRTGRKHEPTFRIVLTDSKNGPKSGKFLEILGSYDARDKNITKINGERIKYWMGVGAKVSDTIHNFLITKKVIDGKKINVLPKKTPIIKEVPKEEVKETVAETKSEDSEEETKAETESETATETVAETATENSEESKPE